MVFLPNDNIEQTKIFLERCEKEWNKTEPCFYDFAVVADRKHIGGIGVYIRGNKGTAELSWILEKSYHGKGYATEAAGAVMDFAKEQLSIQYFVAHCDIENKASQNVMRKLGFHCVACTNERKNKGSCEDRIEMTFERFA